MDGAPPGQPRRALSDGAVAGNFPIRRDLQQRIEGEAALMQMGMRDCEFAAGPATARPQQDIEVDHARAPSLPTPPTEAPLGGFEILEQIGW